MNYQGSPGYNWFCLDFLSARDMKRYIIFLLLLCFPIQVLHAKKKVDRETFAWRYEVEDIGKTGKQGTAVFKVWTYAKKKDAALMQASKNAVHAIVFKGYGIQKPLASDGTVYEKHRAFFNDFFKTGGDYQQFVSLVNNGALEAGDVIKLKKEYKVGVKVSVRKDELRKYLEKSGVIEAMNSMF